MRKTARALITATTLAALVLLCASGCSREPNRADYVSARVRAHCSDRETRRECRLEVMKHYAGVSLEEFQRTQQEPRLRSIWCYFQGSCIPSFTAAPTVAAGGSPPQ